MRDLTRSPEKELAGYFRSLEKKPGRTELALTKLRLHFMVLSWRRIDKTAPQTWGRPGLDRKQRSMLNLAMISVLNRPHELKAHIRGALTNGLTPAEICEVFLQVMIYAGVPAAVDSFRIANEAFAENQVTIT
jgi:alkylhydroperoxidase/carboxymuconolactone decarboxylase family protein YurZ